MDHIKLRTFITVVDTGSINKAAELLKMAPVSLKRQLDAIENEMNTTLLIRNSSGTKLTEAGRLYYDFANKTLNHFGQVTKDIKELSSSVSNTLIICTGKEYATLPLDLFSTEYIIRHPDKKILYLPSSSEDWFDLVQTKRADGAFITYEQYLADNDGSFKFVNMYPRRYMIVLSPNDPLASKQRIDFDDLKDRKVILNAESFPNLYKKLKENHVQVISNTEAPSTSVVFNYISNKQLYITLEPIDKQYAPLKSVEIDFAPIHCGWLVANGTSSTMNEFIELSKETAMKHHLV